MEVRVENIRAIDMFKAKMKNRIRSSKCYRNATLILIGLTALSMALNIFLIIDYAKLKNMTKVELCVNMPPAEPSKKTPMTSAVDLNTKLNPQQATQLTTEDSTSPAATSENHLHTETTPTPDATISQQATDKHTTLLRSINRQTTQTTTEKKPTGATTKKEKETTTRTTSTAATQTLNTTNQTSNRREATTTSARSRNDATTQNSNQTTQAADPSSKPYHTQKSTTTAYNADTSSLSS
uniref:Attachment glycoprotein G n=2 Tax=human metapneumovirus TaxID=162145 RepID=A0A8B0LN17_9MONO|nr:attachment glycoprotein G [Human metapneumovirus]QTW05453.1 attachment glycoprotein G [Human metapneumovirus]WHE09462.1 attachment glycoprotein [Human metapneumovirus]WHE09480.1 attachment glycoprotein [Human metapneumovirus]WHE09489.1 attachment glycoprotein [Human metapneumovirus]